MQLSSERNAQPKHILIIDDHPLFVAGLKQCLLDLDRDLKVSECNNAQQVQEYIQSGAEADYIFLDLQLPNTNGLHILQDLKKQKVKAPVMIVSARQEPAWVHQVLTAGACGFLSKSSPNMELAQALDAVKSGGHFVSTILRRPLDDYRAGLNSLQTGQIKLTKRQHAVLDLVAQGMHNREISAELCISESTVKGHISTLFDVFDVDNRTSCLREAKRFGIL